MARSAASDKRFLERAGDKWRVTIAVPKARQAALGATRLKRSLNTDSLAEANRLKWAVVSEFRCLIAGTPVPAASDPLREEAMALAADRRRLQDDDAAEVLEAVITDRAEQIQGPSIGTEWDRQEGREVEVFDPAKSRKAGEFYAVAMGTGTPLDLHHAAFQAQSRVKARTKADDERALRYLTDWCSAHHVPRTLQAITRKVATRFMDALPQSAEGRGPVTLNKYLNRLSQFWKWLELREHVETNVWAGLKIAAPQANADEAERAFTDAEMVKLLAGPASPAMADLMRIAALTGARLDAIVDLKVSGCSDGSFTFKRQKKEKGSRTVPIHPDLVDIVTRRTAGKAPDDDIFPEWPAPKKDGSLRERSFKTTNQFTIYRRAAGVDERVEGKRRALVNFHSFRRWFITKAEQADQPPHIIATVVGHARSGMTLGRYSGGPLEEQKRRCVEAVRLPMLPKP